jgi:hypothetical protein
MHEDHTAQPVPLLLQKLKSQEEDIANALSRLSDGSDNDGVAAVQRMIDVYERTIAEYGSHALPAYDVRQAVERCKQFRARVVSIKGSGGGSVRRRRFRYGLADNSNNNGGSSSSNKKKEAEAEGRENIVEEEEMQSQERNGHHHMVVVRGVRHCTLYPSAACGGRESEKVAVVYVDNVHDCEIFLPGEGRHSHHQVRIHNSSNCTFHIAGPDRSSIILEGCTGLVFRVSSPEETRILVEDFGWLRRDAPSPNFTITHAE